MPWIVTGMDRITEILRDQHGVLSRRQVLELGYDDACIERMVRRKEWARVHRGVYVDHTGPLSWGQRAWAAVLFCWPAALCADSALLGFGLAAAGRRAADLERAFGIPGRARIGAQMSTAPGDGQIHVAVDQSRRVRRIDGVRVHRLVGFDRALHPSRRPPTLRLEHAVLDVASAAHDEAAAITVIADACQSRRTTPARLARALRPRVRLRGRAFLLDVLEDVAGGAYSVLEHRYLTRVERPHGLPPGARQRRVARGGRRRTATSSTADWAPWWSSTARRGGHHHPARMETGAGELSGGRGGGHGADGSRLDRAAPSVWARVSGALPASGSARRRSIAGTWRRRMLLGRP